MTENTSRIRWFYLAVGVFTMLFSGVLYAWSILKMPFKEEFNWTDSSLALNFTLTMCFFCIGAFLGSLISKKIGHKLTLIIAGLLVGIGFTLTGLLTADKQYVLYISYALLAGAGIGVSYNVTVSTVAGWFPDRKGLCSGCLMMGFGFSTLILGNFIGLMFENASIGWSKTFIILGIVIGAVQILAGLILKKPSEDVVLPAPKPSKIAKAEAFEVRDFTPTEMLKSFTFWRAFVCVAFITAVGNSVISFARDLMISVDAAPALATTLVGVLSVCNGFGRVLTGVFFDAVGRRATMITSNVLTIVAAGVTLIAVMLHSLPLCIVGLCLTGLSYGSCPTVCSAFTSGFYGQKHFSVNYSLVNSNLILAASIASISNNLMLSFGNYTAPFVLLLALAFAALILNFTIRKP